MFFRIRAVDGTPEVKHLSVDFINAFKSFPFDYSLSKKELYQKIIEDYSKGVKGIHPDLFKAYSNNLQRGINGTLNSEKYGDKYFELQQRLNANVSRFSAYKARIVGKEIESIRTDVNGENLPEKEYMQRVKAILNTFNRYQVTEYNTTVARSVTAQQWVDFNGDAEMNKLYPNLKWLPSRSATQREEHIAFYGLVLPKDDPFWQRNQPGNLWNCKCDWEQTDEPASHASPQKNIRAKGLEGNPGITGEIFSENASYFINADKESEDLKQVDERYKKTLQNIKDYLAFDNKKWKHDSFSKQGGYLVIDRERIKQGNFNKQEKAKFDKENNMCSVLCDNGYAVQYLKETIGKYDILLDNVPADLKKTKSHNHILDYAKKAIYKQGGKIVVFEFEKMTEKIHNELNKLERLGVRVIYFISESNDIRYINI